MTSNDNEYNNSEVCSSSQCLSSELLSDEEATETLSCIKDMATSGILESQLEASRVLCDLSLHHSMQQSICNSGCITALINLIHDNLCDWTRQHAIFALANLSEDFECQELMIDAGILPNLLLLAQDAPYHTAEMSRESARILANISRRLALRVVTVLGPKALSVWLDAVDHLKDDRLRLHCCQAKDYLIECVAST